jgi:chromosome partitioning protein
MNAKGGCGKTTVATNLAAYCASQGYATTLFDYDCQDSSMRWLKARPEDCTPINGVAAARPPPAGVTRSWHLRTEPNTRFIVTDTPAGYAGIDLQDRVAESDVILVPVLPSVIDMHSSADFIRDLLLVGKARARNKQIGIIANRTRIRTRSMQKLELFLHKLGIPVVGQIRDTQHYVRAAEQGVGVCELNDSAARRDVEPWVEIFAWIQQCGREKRVAQARPAGADGTAQQAAELPDCLSDGVRGFSA